MCALIFVLLFLILLFGQALNSGFAIVLLGGLALFALGSLATRSSSDDSSKPAEVEQIDPVEQAQAASAALDRKHRKNLAAMEFRRQAVAAGARSEDEVRIFAMHIGVDPDLGVAYFNQPVADEDDNGLETYKWEKIATALQIVVARKAADIAALRNIDLDIASKQKVATLPHGKEKYLAHTRKELSKHDAFDALTEASRSQLRADLRARADTHDPYAWGGMVDGLLGTGAGMVTAMQTIEENAAAEADAASRRAGAFDNFSGNMDIINGARRSLTSRSLLEKRIAAVESRIIDETRPDMYLEKLAITEVEHTITPAGSLDVKLRVEGREEALLLGKPAIIDGSIFVKAVVNGFTVAVGHLVAPGEGVSHFSGRARVGFAGQPDHEPFEARVMLVPPANRPFTEDTRYELTFSPNDLWAIQL